MTQGLAGDTCSSHDALLLLPATATGSLTSPAVPLASVLLSEAMAVPVAEVAAAAAAVAPVVVVVVVD